jgi:hypothetical protein
MIRVIQTNADKVADVANTSAKPRARLHDREAVEVESAQLCQGGWRNSCSINVIDDAAEVADCSARVKDTGTLLARVAKTDETH